MAERVVVVTGGGRGIGRAICRRFAEDGCAVVAAARSVEELGETKAEIERAGGRVHIQPTDLCVAEDIDALVDSTVKRLGRIDVLVNAAGVAPLAAIEELEPSLFQAILAVNVVAVYHASRRVWTVMKGQGGGCIVNISSIASKDPFPGFAAYGASKAWVNVWTKALAEEGRPHGIRVYGVAPGAVETRMLRNAFPTFPADQTLRPSDVADVVQALTQPACRYATGETVFVKRSGD